MLQGVRILLCRCGVKYRILTEERGVHDQAVFFICPECGHLATFHGLIVSVEAEVSPGTWERKGSRWSGGGGTS
jgi:hypothetical protein